jgi:hypothetical protein
MRWKDGLTDEQAIEKILRNWLIRCHKKISKDYPEVAGMEPAQAADFLLHLRKTGRIEIELFNETPTRIGCRITECERPDSSDDQDDEEHS